MASFPITQKGYDRLVDEIKQLKQIERPKIIEAIATARDFGDLSENAEYHEAKKEQSLTEGKISDLEDKMARADIIDVTKLSNDSIKFGATVGLIDDETGENVTYHILGEYEADITKKIVSIASPIAKALIGKIVSDIVEVRTPKGSKSYEVVDIEYKDIDI